MSPFQNVKNLKQVAQTIFFICGSFPLGCCVCADAWWWWWRWGGSCDGAGPCPTPPHRLSRLGPPAPQIRSQSGPGLKRRSLQIVYSIPLVYRSRSGDSMVRIQEKMPRWTMTSIGDAMLWILGQRQPKWWKKWPPCVYSTMSPAMNCY